MHLNYNSNQLKVLRDIIDVYWDNYTIHSSSSSSTLCWKDPELFIFELALVQPIVSLNILTQDHYFMACGREAEWVVLVGEASRKEVTSAICHIK